jgi:hypothetical protein
LVTRAGRDYLADADGEILALADHPEEGLPFTMIGWDETKSEKAMRDNIERVKIYQRMVGEWRAASVLSRCASVQDTTVTRSHTCEPPTRDPARLAERAAALLERTEAGRRPVRLLGAGAHGLLADQMTPAKVQESVLI